MSEMTNKLHYSENYAIYQDDNGEFIFAAYCSNQLGTSQPSLLKWAVDKEVDIAHNLEDIIELHELLGKAIDNAKASSNNVVSPDQQ